METRGRVGVGSHEENDIETGEGETGAHLDMEKQEPTRAVPLDHPHFPPCPASPWPHARAHREPPRASPFTPATPPSPGHSLTWALLQEAVSGLHPVAPALGAPVRGPVALPRALLPALGAAGGARAPARPLVPVSIHCPARGRKGQEPCEHPGPCAPPGTRCEHSPGPTSPTLSLGTKCQHLRAHTPPTSAWDEGTNTPIPRVHG